MGMHLSQSFKEKNKEKKLEIAKVQGEWNLNFLL